MWPALTRSAAGIVLLLLLTGCPQTQYSLERTYSGSYDRSLPDSLGISVRFSLRPESNSTELRIELALLPGTSVQFSGDEVILEDSSNGNRYQARFNRFLLTRPVHGQRTVRYESFAATDILEGLGRDADVVPADMSYTAYDRYSMEGVRFNVVRPSKVRLYLPFAKLNGQTHQFGPLEFAMKAETHWITNIQ